MQKRRSKNIITLTLRYPKRVQKRWNRNKKDISTQASITPFSLGFISIASSSLYRTHSLDTPAHKWSVGLSIFGGLSQTPLFLEVVKERASFPARLAKNITVFSDILTGSRFGPHAKAVNARLPQKTAPTAPPIASPTPGGW